MYHFSEIPADWGRGSCMEEEYQKQLIMAISTTGHKIEIEWD